jgi:multiple sugar transport system substrate-binding protein
MVDSGNPAAKAAAYDDPAVRKAFPMADLIRNSINEAGPRPVTPYYNDVSASVQLTWHPPEGVHAPATPKETQKFMIDVLHGNRLL